MIDNGQDLAGDEFWTIVGYFNAVKELAAGKALTDQDVKIALNLKAKSKSKSPRQLNVVELSGRMESSDLPILLNQLENVEMGDDGCVDILLTTSMFGTGIDVTRLNCMVVGGQPKTTAQYIQATGRVGRKNPALIAAYLRGSRPRDLDHYERFLTYHLQINRFVEPVTVRPFSLTVLEKAAGPLSVAWLRNKKGLISLPWHKKNSASLHRDGEPRPIEFDEFINIVKSRNDKQPPTRRMDPSPPNRIESEIDSGWNRWGVLSIQAEAADKELKWVDYQRFRAEEETFVVLGDERHVKHREKHMAVYSPYHPAPTSLRNVDSTTGVSTRGKSK